MAHKVKKSLYGPG